MRRTAHDSRTTMFAGFSLVELMIVLVLMGVLTAAMTPMFEPSLTDELQATAQIVVADLDYARNLAVSNAGTYRIEFDEVANRYVLRYSGARESLKTLPASPFRKPGDRSDQQVVDLDDLPRLGPAVEIVGAQIDRGSLQAVRDVEFNELGATTRREATVVWLACGQGPQRRFISLSVDPVTGMASVGEITTRVPAGLYN